MLLTLSLRSSSPSPRVTFPLRSSTTTSPTARSSICMQTLQMNAQVSLAPAFARTQRDTSLMRGESAVNVLGDGDLLQICLRARSIELYASSPGEFPGLEAFLAEPRAPLRRLEGHRRFLSTGGTGRHRFDPLAGPPGPRRPGGAFALAGLAPLGLVLEVLVGEKLLFARRPDELRAAV